MQPSDAKAPEPKIFKATVRNVTNVSPGPGKPAPVGHNVIVHTRGGHVELRPGQTLENASFEEGELTSMRNSVRKDRGERASIQIIDHWAEDENGVRVESKALTQEPAQGDAGDGRGKVVDGKEAQPNANAGEPGGSFTVASSGTNDDDRARSGQPQKTGEAPSNTGENQPAVTGDAGGNVASGGGGPGEQATGQDGGAGQGGTQGDQAAAGQAGDLSGQSVEQLRATALREGIDVKTSWGKDRLAQEIEKARAAK